MANVTVYIASLPQREYLNTVLQSVLLQDEVAAVVCMLNNYKNKNGLLKDKRVKYIIRKNQKGCSEKFYDVKNCKTKYVAFMDDDFTIASGYFEKLINGAEKHKGLVSFHGSTFRKLPIVNYYKDRFLYHCRGVLHQDMPVHVVGSGVCLFDRKLMTGIETLYNKIYYPNMSDIYLSALALYNGLPCVVLAHSDAMIFPKPYDIKDNYIFDRYKNNCLPQTQFINKYFKCK